MTVRESPSTVNFNLWTRITAIGMLHTFLILSDAWSPSAPKKTDVVSPSSAELRKACRSHCDPAEKRQDHAADSQTLQRLLPHSRPTESGDHVSCAVVGDIVANSSFDSNDTALVKEHLRRMVSVQVEWSTGTSSQKPGRKWGYFDADRRCRNSGRPEYPPRVSRIFLCAQNQEEASRSRSIRAPEPAISKSIAQ